jgi:hypothetical protein
VGGTAGKCERDVARVADASVGPDVLAEATRLVLLQRLLKNFKLGVLESQCADCV